MGERRIPYLIVWLLFVGSLLVGAGLMLSPDGRWQVLGFVLLFAPLLAFGLLMALYYWRSRRIEDGSA